MAAEEGTAGVRDAASLGEITPEVLREVFPQWRIFPSGGRWRAMRGGKHRWDGPESLLMPVLSAPDITGLADQLCLQEWLRGLEPAELEAVFRGTAPGGGQ